jgi:hypothetical protein
MFQCIQTQQLTVDTHMQIHERHSRSYVPMSSCEGRCGSIDLQHVSEDDPICTCTLQIAGAEVKPASLVTNAKP